MEERRGERAAWRDRLREGVVIPAHPLALRSDHSLDERRQRALTRYYVAAGAGGLAVGVHTTQFAIHDPKIALLRPVLQLAAETLADARHGDGLIRIAGICGETAQAVAEAELAVELGYHAGLVSPAALSASEEADWAAHIRTVADTIPVIAFYLQPAVGGRVLPYTFWRRVLEIEQVVAIKIAPFNRYQTLEVFRAVVDAGRAGEIALYTGNDDHIVLDLLTTFRPTGDGAAVTVVGGLLGQWSVWTRRAVEYHSECRRIVKSGRAVPPQLLTLAAQVTDANAAIFDPANEFAGCIPGIHEVLRRQGLLAGTWTLGTEALAPDQRLAIDRVCRSYPHLTDDAFVAEHLDDWLR